jgi:hypothetical protein
MVKKQRFKDRDFNTVYWQWINATPEQVENIVRFAGSNRDMAFKHGFKNFPCKFQRNWILYPIYVAGKEWRKHNKQHEHLEIYKS